MLARATDAVQDVQEYPDFSPILGYYWRRPPKHPLDEQPVCPCKTRGRLQIILDLSNSPIARRGLHTNNFIQTHRNGVGQFMHNCYGCRFNVE
jgi:hypothetical protein